MIKPRMPHTLTAASVPLLDPDGNPIYDRFDRQQFTTVSTKARTQEKSSLKTNAQGQDVASTIEVDVPPGVIVPTGTGVTYTMSGGRTGSGTVVDTEESLTFAGRCVFRTLFING